MATSFDLENFLEMLAAERGAAENTLAGYRRDLEDFSVFLGKKRIAAAQSDDISAYMGNLTSRGFAESSQARRLSALKQFFKFLYSEGTRQDDPTRTLSAPKKRGSLPKVLSMNFYHWAALAYAIARKPGFAPVRPFINGKDFRLARHPGRNRFH